MATPNPNEFLLVLVVDDEPMVLRAASSVLATAGFGVIVAEHGVAGLEAFARMPEAIDLVLADIIMPFLGGIEMAEKIREIRPEVPIVLMTAYSDVVISKLAPVKYPLIRKPFLPEDLVRIVRESI